MTLNDTGDQDIYQTDPTMCPLPMTRVYGPNAYAAYPPPPAVVTPVKSKMLLLALSAFGVSAGDRLNRVVLLITRCDKCA